MKNPLLNKHGFTVTELIVVLVVIFVLCVLSSMPIDHGAPRTKGYLLQAVYNARQIHIATMSMANDGAANENSSLGWPGDLKARGKIQTAQDFVNLLVKGDYLKPADLKVFGAYGVESYRLKDNNSTFSPPFEEKNNAFKIYLTKEDDRFETVFLASKNYTYNMPLDAKAKPFGETGFVIARKGGDVSMYKKQHAQTLELLGPLPGGGTVESGSNCLNL